MLRKEKKMGVVANTDRLAEVPDVILVQIANFVASGGLRDEEEGRKGAEGVVQRLRQLGLLRSTNKHIREITVDAGRQALAFVMRLALPQTLSTQMFLTVMHKSSDLAGSLLLQNKSAKLSRACTQSEAAILSRLVELSRAAARARAAIEAAGKLQADDASEAAVAAREAARDAPKLLGLIERVIESARPALRASLSRARVGSSRMYRQLDKVLIAVMRRLKGRPYERIADGISESGSTYLQIHVESFLSNVAESDAIERFGPLCLWDVSEVRDFGHACSSVNFNSDLFWDTGSAEQMDDMFVANEGFEGYTGTWNVRRVKSMGGMFAQTAIEDSGIANWNTASLTDASGMFFGARRLSASLDLSGWIFGPEPNLCSMFAQSGIVDCGIGNWDVAGAQTHDILLGADRFTGSLANWPPENVERSQAPARPSFGSARVDVGGEDTEKRIAGVFAAALRAKGAGGQEQCAIL